MNELIYYDEITQSLSKAVYHAHANLKNVNGLLKMTIQAGMWRKRMATITGEIVEFKTFEDYVIAKPPHGLGTDIATLKWLCLGDDELIALIDMASQIIPVSSELQVASEHPVGRKLKRFGRDWTIQKLIDVNRLDLIKELSADKLTPYEVQIKMGWRKKKS